MSAQITAVSGGPYSRILGFGSFRPARVVPNSELVERIDSSDEWIQERSGIVERRWAGDDETVVDMATTAAQRALADAGLEGSDIDAVIVSTVSNLVITPSVAAIVAGRIGSRGAALDISAACAGFSYGVNIADGLVRAGSATHVLVIGAEKLSDFTDLDDRGTAFLFADGAGAAIVGPSDTPGIGPAVWGSDGSQAEVITSTPRRPRRTDPVTEHGDARPVLTMQGQSVFRWAVAEMAKAAAEAVAAAGIRPEDLDCFIPHQANNRITDAMIKYLGLPENVTVARDISHMGNTSAASIPLAMDALRAEGRLPAGGLALLIGFGAGLVWSAQVVRIPG
ncbi:MAG: ketoacyl-ACP synthase III [Actinomycetales bacterium]|nr:ketoacyl-ACP synthase III [Actinomycetales bacterium]